MSDFIFKKSLGQNFLVDNNIVNKISNSINATCDDLIIEIGPGSGALTKKLKEKGALLFCFEIDERLKNKLCNFEDVNTFIIFEDFLEVNIEDFLKDKVYNRLYIVGNIPYYITSQIVYKIIDESEADEVILMVQKEVADRYKAKCKSKEYGYISVVLQYNFNVSSVVNVNKKCFFPVPKVDSEVIKLERRKKESVKDEKLFYEFLKECFKMKRKKLKNNLSRYDFNIIEEYLIKNNISVSCRSEELSVIDFVNIFNLIN